ncbi:MAG TPA: VWA domain-containing protein [Acidobacteriota bacterium]
MKKPIRTEVDTVLVDLVARDKKGKMVNDLDAAQIEVYEDGVRQNVSWFRKVERPLIVSGGPAEKSAAALFDPTRPLTLLTLVFDQLNDLEARRLAHQASMTLLKESLPQNVFAAVFKIDRRTYALQKFTADRDLLQRAVEKATRGSYTQFASQSDEIKKESEKTIAMEATLSAALPATGPPRENPGGAAAELQMARVMLNMLQSIDEMQRDIQGQSALHGLLGIVREQREIVGRKTVIYFSEGLRVPPPVAELYRATISEANRANVSVYAIDARGLNSTLLGQEGQQMLGRAARTSAGQMQSSGRPVTAEEAKLSDTAEASTTMNTQEPLADLARSTGGLLIANTNDLRPGIQRVEEDLRTHYELAYTSQNKDYNGKFRSISVKISRPNVTLQARNGYFALPPSVGNVLPFEMPMLALLGSTTPSRDFDYRAATFRFEPESEGVRHSLIVEVPISSFQLTPQADKKTYRARFSVLALVRDRDGAVVEKITQDSPLQGPLEKIDDVKSRNYVLMRTFQVSPGRYTLETVVLDRESNKASVRRSILIVPEVSKELALSSLAVVKRIDPIAAGQTNPDDPFRFEDGKVVPNIGDIFRPAPNGPLALYFVIYAHSGAPKPELTLEFLKDGQTAGRGSPDLPPPNSLGRIPFVATIPLDKFESGRYEVKATVRQGASVASERIGLTLEK